MVTILLALLAQSPMPMVYTDPNYPTRKVPAARMVDGGYGIPVTCDNCSSSASAGLTNGELRASPVVVSAYVGFDAGYVSVANFPASQAVTGTFWQASQPVSGSLTCNAGTNLDTSALALNATLTSRAQKSQVTDGTRDGTVKAASTAAVAADTALVVAVSPNNTVSTQVTDGTFGADVMFSSTSEAENVSNALKVRASLSLHDTGAPAGSRLVPAPGDTSTGLWVNVKNVAVPVTGTFWPATQPVSGTVTANAGTGTMAVSGTFWPATQDVGGSVMILGQNGQTISYPEDGAHTSGHNTLLTAGVVKETNAQVVDADGDYAFRTMDRYGVQSVSGRHPNAVRCTITSTATTSTVVTGCSAPGAGLSIYITGLAWSSSIISTTANFMRIQSGTGGTCGTGTTVLYDGYALAFTSVPVQFPTPIKVAANSEVCFVHAAAGTRLVNIVGFIAP